MPQKVRIALDAMGGDLGASVVIPGAAIAVLAIAISAVVDWVMDWNAENGKVRDHG